MRGFFHMFAMKTLKASSKMFHRFIFEQLLGIILPFLITRGGKRHFSHEAINDV